MTIGKNVYTNKMRREDRFLIDDEDSDLMLAYELTKPWKLGGTYNGAGVFKFVLQEVNTTDNDNQELRIADYYKYYPKNETDIDSVSENAGSDATSTEDTGRRGWI